MLLEHLTKVPDEFDNYNVWPYIEIAIRELNQYIPREIGGRMRVGYSDDFGYMMRLTYYVDAINCIDNDARAVFWHRRDSKNQFITHVNGEVVLENTIGMVINEEASTHFHEEDYHHIERMPALEKLLKQTSSHFLRIFTNRYDRVLYVWTNKRLDANTFFSLKVIQNKLNNEYLNEPKAYVRDFYDALKEKDIDKVRESLNTFLESDYVKNYAMRKFQECMTYNITNNITSLEHALTSYRRSITEHENTIMTLATQIRETNEKIESLKGKDQKEDIEILYKYLCKHPYIKKFTPKDNGRLQLDFVSPLIYFNEYALDKLISNRSGEEKIIFRTFKERRYTLMTVCRIAFDTDDFRAIIENIDSSNKDYFPHPHIELYGCFGNHQEAIADSAISGDYLGAIEQISQATLNMNFYDTCVANGLVRCMRDSYRNTKTWLDNETGELISFEEILRRENEQ